MNNTSPLEMKFVFHTNNQKLIVFLKKTTVEASSYNFRIVKELS